MMCKALLQNNAYKAEFAMIPYTCNFIDIVSIM